MNAKRAREIASSPVMVDVTHDGVPIYIESVISDNAAMVHPLNNPNSHKKVSLSELVER